MTQSRNFWNKVAAKYTKQPISDLQTYARKLSETQALMNSQMDVLEIGCGSGATAIAHSPHVRTIVATDIADEMIEIGQAKAKDVGIENITFIRAGIDSIEGIESTDGIGITQESYDMILALNLFHLIEDRKSALSTIHRLLKPGGVFISSTPCLADKLWILLPFLSLFAKIGKAPKINFFGMKKFLLEIEGTGFKNDQYWTHGYTNTLFLVSRKT